MLKRKDLAKEFSLIVQQEIKNHNDQILATNIAINKFNVKLDEFSCSLSRELDQIKSNLTAESDDRKTTYRIFHKEICEQRDDIRNVDRITDEFIKSIDNQLEALNITKFDKSELHKIEEDIGNLGERIYQNFIGVQNQISIDNKRFQQKLIALEEKMRAEFKESPDHTKNMEDHLLQKIEEHAINNSCLVQEVAACKKTALVTEKKYEYLQTRYQRLKKKLEGES